MDPEATVEAMLDDLRAGDYGAAMHRMGDLIAWRQAGGYAPALRPLP